MSRPAAPPGSPRRLGALSTAQLRALLQDEPRLQRAARLCRKAQIKQFLAQELPLEAFLESFCQSRTRSHVCRTQLEKLQELLHKEQVQKDQVGRKDPAGCPGAPASVAPAAAPFPVPAAPPKHHLPALAQQPASPCSEVPGLGSPLRPAGAVPVPSAQPREQEPPHR
uniref:VPS37D subunit of ESCRT-I n=1 Tax=Junco hyemalis TaxID=40217 RepID=A0A8C5IJL8_JUNHY